MFYKFYDTTVATIMAGNTPKLRIIISRGANNSSFDDTEIYSRFAKHIYDAISNDQIQITRYINETSTTFTLDLADAKKVIRCLNNLGSSFNIKMPDNFKKDIFELAKKIDKFLLQNETQQLASINQNSTTTSHHSTAQASIVSTPHISADDFDELTGEQPLDQRLPDGPESTAIRSQYSGLKR